MKNKKKLFTFILLFLVTDYIDACEPNVCLKKFREDDCDGVPYKDLDFYSNEINNDESNKEKHFTLSNFIENAELRLAFEGISSMEFDDLNKTLQEVIKQQVVFVNNNNIDIHLLSDSIVAPYSKAEEKITYVQKVIADNILDIAFIGDIHGSAEALTICLRKLRDSNKLKFFDEDFNLLNNKMIVFTGDIADRGPFGIEAWFIIWLLMLKNHGKVLVCRGNHEEISVANGVGGIFSEFDKKYWDILNRDAFKHDLAFFFSLLPSTIFIGKPGSFLQVSHGCIPYDPATENYMAYNRFENFLKKDDKETTMVITDAIGSIIRWGDIINGYNISKSNRFGAAPEKDIYIYNVGIKLAEMLSKKLGIRNLFRGHNHNPSAVSKFEDKLNVKDPCDCWTSLEKNKTISLDKNFAYTFMCCPDGGKWLREICKQYGFGLVHIAGPYEKWTIRPFGFVN